MKKTLTTIGLAAIALAGAQSQVVIGDIAIIQVNNATDAFTWVALADISSAATWTDSSWGGQGTEPNKYGWRTSENTTGVLPSSIAAGTIGTVSGGTGFANAGEQVFLYNNDGSNFTATTSATDAKFIFGIQWDRASGWLTSGEYGTGTSYQPSTLAGYGLALGTGDNWYYNGAVSGTKTELLALITNPANWAVHTNTADQWAGIRSGVASFSVIPEPATWSLLGIGAAILVWRNRRRSA